jgi:hypothetical protein
LRIGIVDKLTGDRTLRSALAYDWYNSQLLSLSAMFFEETYVRLTFAHNPSAATDCLGLRRKHESRRRSAGTYNISLDLIDYM